MSRPRSNKEKPKLPPEAAFFPKLKGKWQYIYSDGEKEWHPTSAKGRAPDPKGKFAFVIGHSEVFDTGFQVTRQSSFSELVSEAPSRWARVSWMHSADSAKLIGFWGTDENGNKWSLDLSDAKLTTRIIEGPILSVTQKWQRACSKNWWQIDQTDTAAILAAPPDWLDNDQGHSENFICRRPPFPPVNRSSTPHRIVWWIRRNEGLLRLSKPPNSSEKLVATVYHFCPAPGAVARVEIVEPFTAEERTSLKEQTQPCLFSEYLEQLQLQIAQFKDTPQQISDPESTETYFHVRLNPVWDLYQEAAGSLHRLRTLLAYKAAAETAEQRQALIERIAREALILGEKSTLLFISPKIPILRRREKMDESAGRPVKTTQIRAAVVEFVTQYQNFKAAAIFARLLKLARSGGGQIGWNDIQDVFHHEAEEKPEWSKTTMLKEIRAALRRLKKSL
ncbi:MAG: hypothetical protein V4675_06085 [Verrucomicrobiota bacterium]